MAKFIQLTDADTGRPVVFNVDHIVAFAETPRGYTAIATTEPDTARRTFVRETVATVVDKLR